MKKFTAISFATCTRHLHANIHTNNRVRVAYATPPSHLLGELKTLMMVMGTVNTQQHNAITSMREENLRK